ncbi:MAG: sugar ABC transporter ATP-binding protein [Microbacteriaceae bacterium]|nr:sugar ABC transporter ATP-binding protein [Microbacteriaceae bacterium]
MAAVVEAKSITKAFGGVKAVDDVSVSVSAGEIHAVVGENGAGKSTLMRILSGIEFQDTGQVLVDGQEIEKSNPKAAIDAGISLVHQELSLVPEMTVAENIYLGGFPTKAGFTKQNEMKQFALETLKEIGVEVDIDERISRLSVALRQFVEIARAIARKPKVLILDEPTASLTPAETDYLLSMLERLAKQGLAIIYISHRIPEVFRLCHNVTILRDGKLVYVSEIKKTTPQEVINQMVGRELKMDLGSRRDAKPGEVVMSAKGIRAPGVNNISLDVRAGEIVGLGGLVGAGRTELVRAIIGADNKTAGNVTITLDGKEQQITSYMSAMRNGVAYVPEERRVDGLAMTMTVNDNVYLPNRKDLANNGIINPGKVAKVAKALADKVGLRPPEIKREAGQYSGGNQQKIVIAKWLHKNPKFVVLDEPTRGVDVGAKAEIHRLVKALADQGTAVLVVSSDLPELLELSDVIHVVRDGQIMGTLDGAKADEKQVMGLAAGENLVEA